MNIGIYIYELAEELDWAGPWEVLAAWADRASDVQVFTITDTESPVRCAKGLRVLGDHTWETAPELDVLVVPGGDSRGPGRGRGADRADPRVARTRRAPDECLHRRIRPTGRRCARGQAGDHALGLGGAIARHSALRCGTSASSTPAT